MHFGSHCNSLRQSGTNVTSTLDVCAIIARSFSTRHPLRPYRKTRNPPPRMRVTFHKTR